MRLCGVDDVMCGPPPALLTALDEIREHDDFWDVGTHSILDVDHVVASTAEDHDGSVRELPVAEARQVFGTNTSSLQQFEAVPEMSLPDRRRWSGFYQLLYVDGTPTEIAFWARPATDS